MDALFLIYNLLLLVFYSIPLAFSWFIYRKGDRDTLHLYISIFFLVYIINNLVIYLTESVSWFSTFYDSTFMSVPTLRTIIFATTFYCMVKVNELALRKENSIGLTSGLLVLVIFLLFVPIMPNSAFKVWLYYTSCQVFTFILGLYGLRCIKHAPKGHYSEYVTQKYRRILLWTVVFSVLIVLEDTFVIFNFDVYTDSFVQIVNRSFTEDVISIYYAFVAIQYLTKLIHVKAVPGELALCASTGNAAMDNMDILYSNPVDDAAATLPSSPPAASPFVSDGKTAPVSSNRTTFSPDNTTDFTPGNATAFTPDALNTANSYSKFYLFCRKYCLTTREQDIMRLLLENKNNMDISEELVISIGTAKTHIHNIFTKLEVKKRHQLIEKYNTFKDTEPMGKGNMENT